jgi:nucleoid DNA-binding protein
MVNPPNAETAMAAFAVRAAESTPIDLEEVDERLIGRSDLLEHLNAVVFGPALGGELKTEKIKEILDGLSEAYMALLIAGAHVKFGRLGTFRSKKVPPGTRRNPRTQEFIEHEMRRIDFDSSRRVKGLLRQRQE